MIVLLRKSIFHRFLQFYPHHEQFGLFDDLNRDPWFDMATLRLRRFEMIVEMIEDEVTLPFENTALISFIYVLLLTANLDYSKIVSLPLRSDQTIQMIKLRNLVRENFLVQREARYYAAILGITPAQLNNLVKKSSGKKLNELIADHVLSESELRLSQHNVSIKEIAFDLRFSSASHFSYFFKKHTGFSPKDFRKQFF